MTGFWGSGWLSRYLLLHDDSETNWLGNMFRKHRKAFSYLEHLVVLHAFMVPGWKLADIVAAVARLGPATKTPTKELEGSDERELSEYRLRWAAAVKEHGTKRARLNGFGDIYAWLYRHDRQWLTDVNRIHKVPEPAHPTKVDWHRRDIDTLKMLSTLRNESESRLDDPRHSANWYLNQLVHKATIEKHMELLPLSSLFFERYCENIFEYQIRRMTRTVIQITSEGEPLKRWQVLKWSGLSEDRLTGPASSFLKEVLGI